MSHDQTTRACCNDPGVACRCEIQELRRTGVYQFCGSSGPRITMCCPKRMRQILNRAIAEREAINNAA